MSKLPKNVPLYRVKLTAGIGKKVLDGGDPPAGVSVERYVMYLILTALEDLAEGIELATAAPPPEPAEDRR